MKDRLSFAALALLVAVVMAACGAEDPTPTPRATATPTPVSGDSTPTSEPANPTPTAEPNFDAESHFRGKTIDLIVDFKPGGGTDLQARYFASNWGRFIPGNPNIRVRNMPPNPSGRNYVWDSPADGLTLSFGASAGVGTEYVDPAADFESVRFTQIGSHAKRDVIWITLGEVPYDTLRDARNGSTPLTLAEEIGNVGDLTGKMLAAGMLAMWFEAPLEFKTVVTGGSSDDLIMLERGDVNGYIAGSHWYSLPTLRPGWFADGFVKPIADMSHPAAPSIPNDEIEMPFENVIEWLTPEQKKLWEGLVLPDVLSGKNISGPPDMDPAIAKVLRDAYVAALNDPEFAAELADLQGQPVALIDGETLQAEVEAATASFVENLPQYEEIRQQVFDRFVN